MWGFGAKFGGVTRHLFQLGNAETVHGSVEGILDAYKGIFQSDLIMSGPTMFDQVRHGFVRSVCLLSRKETSFTPIAPTIGDSSSRSASQQTQGEYYYLFQQVHFC